MATAVRQYNWALIIGSATLNELPYRAKRPKHTNNKAFDKSGVYSKLPKVADAVIEAPNCPCRNQLPSMDPVHH